MNNALKLILSIMLPAISLVVPAQTRVNLFTDRNSCLSGDTVWFDAVVFSPDQIPSGKIIHVQLDNLTGNHITKASVVCDGVSAPGYLYIPDSLSTGLYILKAFSNEMKGENAAVIRLRYLVVYNRFSENIATMEIPGSNERTFESSESISLNTGLNENPGKKNITVNLKVEEDVCQSLREIIVTARLSDPLSDKLGSFYAETSLREKNPFMAVPEKNAILITGRVLDENTNEPIVTTPVLLSISDTIPYLDYCVTDDRGQFYFYIRNAKGKGDIVLQAVSGNANNHRIELFENYIETEAVAATAQILTLDQQNFATDLVKASYFSRLFQNNSTLAEDSFSIIPELDIPFYGVPTKTFYPDLFIDLPDFQEISREILQGVMYRDKKNKVTIRLLNNGNKSVFTEEPLKLMDGIPVFDPAFFRHLSSQDIRKVDAVFYKRYFGDLSFNGVLSVYSTNPSLGWVESAPGLNIFKYNFIQNPKTWNFRNEPKRRAHQPDFSQVFFRERLTTIPLSKDFSFDVSDIDGNIIIEVIAVCSDDTIIRKSELVTLESKQ